MMQPVSALVWWLCCGSGLVIIAAAIPLWLNRVPPNAVYGARFAATLADPQIWYAINAKAGRSLVIIGAFYAIAVGAIGVIPSWNHVGTLLGVTGALVAALIGNTIWLTMAGSRLRSMRKR